MHSSTQPDFNLLICMEIIDLLELIDCNSIDNIDEFISIRLLNYIAYAASIKIRVRYVGNLLRFLCKSAVVTAIYLEHSLITTGSTFCDTK